MTPLPAFIDAIIKKFKKIIFPARPIEPLEIPKPVPVPPQADNSNSKTSESKNNPPAADKPPERPKLTFFEIQGEIDRLLEQLPDSADKTDIQRNRIEGDNAYDDIYDSRSLRELEIAYISAKDSFSTAAWIAARIGQNDLADLFHDLKDHARKTFRQLS